MIFTWWSLVLLPSLVILGCSTWTAEKKFELHVSHAHAMLTLPSSNNKSLIYCLCGCKPCSCYWVHLTTEVFYTAYKLYLPTHFGCMKRRVAIDVVSFPDQLPTKGEKGLARFESFLGCAESAVLKSGERQSDNWNVESYKTYHMLNANKSMCALPLFVYCQLGTRLVTILPDSVQPR